MTVFNRRKRSWCLKLTTGLLFAVVAYGGAYATLVVPRRYVYPDNHLPPQPWYWYPRPLSNNLGTELQPSFAPAHWLDRKLRPEVWK